MAYGSNGSKYGGTITYGVKFEADQTGLKNLQNALQQIQKVSPKSFSGPAADLREIKVLAGEVEDKLKAAFNSNLGSFNVTEARKALQSLDLDKIHNQFMRLGSVGSSAFTQVTKSMLSANVQLKQTSGFLDKLGTTMLNTVKWNIASSAMNSFTGSIQQAFGYIKSLDSSLNNIQIVTQASSEKMADFAVQANNAAQALGKTTNDYTQAALIFYQQGLGDAEVEERTDVTLKMANVTKDSASQVSSYMTAIWNNFDDGSKALEYYADVITNLGANTASSSAEIAQGLSKFAAVADTVGLSYEYATTALATLVAETRQSPEVIGTALKTLFARIQDLELGDTLEDGTTLGKYSQALEAVGINIKDANGEVKNMDQILDEMGSKWETLGKDTQIALAQTVAGTRQYTQLVALMDNWDVFGKNLEYASESAGTLQKQQDIYMDSLEAHLKQLTAAKEGVIDSFLNADSFKTFIDAGTGILNFFENLIDSVGGGGNAILAFGSILTSVFSKQLSAEINSIVTNFQNLASNKAAFEQLQANVNYIQGSKAYGHEATQGMTNTVQNALQYKNLMSPEQFKEQIALAGELGDAIDQRVNFEKSKESAEKFFATFKEGKLKAEEFKNAFAGITDDNLDGKLQKITNLFKDLQNNGMAAGRAVEESLSTATITDAQKQQIEEYIQSVEKLGLNSETVKGKIEALRAALESGSAASTSSAFNNLISDNDIANAQRAYETLTEGSQKYQDALNREKAVLAQVKTTQDPFAQQATIQKYLQATSAVTSLVFAFNSLKNLGNVWSNENLSTGEKVLQTITSIGMATGMAIPALLKLNNVLGLTNTLTALNSAYTGTNNTVQTVATALKHKDVIASTLQQKVLKNGVISLRQKQAAVWSEILGEELHIGLQKKDTTERILNAAAINTQKIALLGYVAILAAVAVAIYAAIKAYDSFNLSAEEAAKEASEAAKKLSEAYQEAKQKAEDLNNAFSNYDNAVNALHECTRGTEEWKNALQEVNDQVLDLITKYPELLNYADLYKRNEDGMLELNADVVDQVKAEMEQSVSAMQAASLYGQAFSSQAANRVTEEGIRNKYLMQDYGNGAAYGRGSQNYEAVDYALKNIEEFANLTPEELQSKLESSYENLSLNFETLSAELREFGQASEQVKTAMDNAALATINASGELDKFSDKNKGFAQQFLGDAFNESIEDTAQDIENNLRLNLTRLSDLSNDQSVVISDTIRGGTQLLEALNEAQGTDWDYDANEVRHGYDSRSFAFRDEEGELHELTAKQVATTLAAKEALDKLGIAADEAAKFLSNIDDVVGPEVGEGIKQWLATGDLTGLKQEDYNELQGQINAAGSEENYLRRLFGGQEQLDKYLDATGQSLDQLAESLRNSETGYEEAIYKSLERVSHAVNDVFDESKFSKFAPDITTSVIDLMQSAWAATDKEGAAAVQDIFSSLNEENANILSNVLKEGEFSNLDELTTKLEELGYSGTTAKDKLEPILNTFKKISEDTSMDAVTEKYAAIAKIGKDLEKGGEISADDYKKLGDGFESFFQRMADGTYQLTGDAEDFYNKIKEKSAEGYQERIDENNQKIASIANVQGNITSSGKSTDQYVNDLSAESANVKGDFLGGLAIANEDVVEQQYNFLKAIGLTTEELAPYKDTLEQVQKLMPVSKESLEALTAAVGEHRGETSSLTETLQALDAENKEMQGGLAASASTWEEFDSILAESSLSYDEFRNAQDAFINSHLAQIDAFEIGREEFDDYVNSLLETSQSYQELKEAQSQLDPEQDKEAYESITEQIEELTDDLQRAALAHYELEDGVADLQKAFKKISGSLEDTGRSINELSTSELSELKASLEQILGQEIDTSFIQNNLEAIQRLAEGDTSALEELELAAASLSIDNLTVSPEIDTTGFEMAKEALMLSIQETDLGNLEVGTNLDTTPMYDAIQTLMTDFGVSAEEINAILGNIGFSPLLTFVDVPLATNQDTFGEANVGTTQEVIDTEGNSHKVVITSDIVQQAASGNTETVKIPVINGNSTYRGSGNSFSPTHVNTSPKSSGGGGGGGKGGGSQKTKTPKTEKTKKAPERKRADPYHDINKTLQKISDNYERASEEQDKLIGKKAQENLKKQNKLLKEQNDTLGKKLEINAKEQAYYRRQLKGAGVGIDDGSFNADGTLKDGVYEKAIEKMNDKVQNAYAAYNDWITNVYNNMSADEQEKASTTAKKEELEQAIKDAEDAQKDLDNVLDKYQNEMALEQEIKDQILDNLSTIIENQVEQFNFKIKAKLDVIELRKDWNDFRKEMFSDDNFAGRAKLNEGILGTLIGKSGKGGVVKSLGNHASTIIEEITKMQNGEISDVYSAVDKKTGLVVNDMKAAQEDLKETLSNLQDAVLEAKEAVEDSYEEVQNAIEAAKDAYETQEEMYGQMSDWLDYDSDYLTALYGEDYDKGAILGQQRNINDQQIDFYQQQRTDWAAKMEDMQRKMAATADKSSLQYAKYEELYEEYRQNWIDATDKLYQTVADQLEKLGEIYENAVGNIIKSFQGDILGDSIGFVQDQWDAAQEKADKYFDAVQNNIELGNLQLDWDKDLKDLNGNIKAQEKLNKAQKEQMDILKEKAKTNKLSQYDIDLAKAKLEITKAQMALDDAAQAKTKMRLRRDSQGNYSYQFVADEDDVESKRQKLLETTAEWYDLVNEKRKDTVDAFLEDVDTIGKELQEKILTVNQEYEKTMADIDARLANKTITKEQAEIERKAAEETRDKQIGWYTEEAREKIQDTLAGLQEVSAEIANNLGNYFPDLTDEEMDQIINRYSDLGNGFIDNLLNGDDSKAALDGFVNNLVEGILGATDRYTLGVEETIKQTGNNPGDIAKGEDTNVGVIGTFVKDNKQLVDQNSKLINTTQKMFENQLKSFSTFEQLFKKGVDNLDKMEAFLEGTYDSGLKDNSSYLDQADSLNLQSGELTSDKTVNKHLNKSREVMLNATNEKAMNNGELKSAFDSYYKDAKKELKQIVNMNVNFDNINDVQMIKDALIDIMNLAAQQVEVKK